MEKSALRLWKRLSAEDRLAAARAYWAAPAEDVLARAIDSIAKARRMRPQAVRSMSDEERAGALGLSHEDGVLDDDDDARPVTLEDAQRALERIRADHPADQLAVYLNTLWLQDPERWGALSGLDLRPPDSPSPAPGS